MRIRSSPERAKQDSCPQTCSAPSGRCYSQHPSNSQGGALGWHVAAPSGRDSRSATSKFARGGKVGGVWAFFPPCEGANRGVLRVPLRLARFGIQAIENRSKPCPDETCYSLKLDYDVIWRAFIKVQRNDLFIRIFSGQLRGFSLPFLQPFYLRGTTLRFPLRPSSSFVPCEPPIRRIGIRLRGRIGLGHGHRVLARADRWQREILPHRLFGPAIKGIPLDNQRGIVQRVAAPVGCPARQQPKLCCPIPATPTPITVSVSPDDAQEGEGRRGLYLGSAPLQQDRQGDRIEDQNEPRADGHATEAAAGAPPART